MNRLVFILTLIFIICNKNLVAQESTLQIKTKKDSLKTHVIDPLSPSKAAFYSAVLPGLGQAYNKKYWKIPLAYAGIGAGIYFYNDNNKNYKKFRAIFKRRLEGFTDDEFANIYSNDVLINAQRMYQRNRDISLLVTIGVYILNIIDANVDAHLIQFNVNKNLSLKPDLYQNEIDYKYNLGLTLNYKF